MISVSALSMQFGGTFLFDNVSFMISERDKIGLVGKNGAGKSTLLNILAGNISPETGTVARSSITSVGYLPQDVLSKAGKTVIEETLTAFSEQQELERKIHELSDELSHRQDTNSAEYHDLIHELTEANDRFTQTGGWAMQGEVEKVLLGLGFESRDFDRQTSEFSGGWQMRIELAKILLRHPSCILLDEPTNHLDIDSLTWLEGFLSHYEGAVVVISHDRAFLDAITTRTLEISLGEIHDYPAAYSRYVQMRAERRAQQLAAYKNQQKEIAETERFIERFRYKATKANQVQSRIKALDKLDRIEVEDEDTSAVRFRFPEAPRSGRMVFEAEAVTKRFETHTVLKNIHFVVERGDKIAFVGKNGEGKTTFSKMLVGKESFDGTIRTGHNVEIGYYAQHQAEMLDPDATVLDIIDRAATGEMRTKIRDLLGAFLFSGDSVYKKVKVLSGGEKSRLALAKLLLEPINALILDEPTNHLDMRSKDVLKQALMEYDGALIVVSHDRDFLQGLTTKVVEFKGGSLKEYDGDIYEFLRLKNLQTLEDLQSMKSVTESRNIDKPIIAEPENPEQSITSDIKLDNQISWEEKKQRDKEIRRLQRQLEQIEREITNLETEIQILEKTMNNPDFYSLPDSKKKLLDHAKLQAELVQKMETWEQLHKQIV